MNNIFSRRAILACTCLLTVLAVGAWFRIYQLSTVPYGLFCDEANIGYSAYSLITTGKDEHGDSWPIFFRGFGEWRLPLSIYLQFPSITAFGLSVFSVRLTAAVLGVVSILLFFLIGRNWADSTLGLVCALSFSLSPWAIHLSRNSMEWSYPIPFLLFSVLLFSKSLTNIRYFPLGALSMALASYTYYASVFIGPAMFVLTVLYFLKYKRSTKFIALGVIIFIIVFLPLGKSLADNRITSRFRTVMQSGQSGLSGSDRLLSFAGVYFNHFSPDFLFFHTKDYEFITRHSVRGVGQFPRYAIIFIPFGLLFLWQIRKTPGKTYIILVVLGLLALYPLPGLFNENRYPTATRGVVGLIPFSFLIGLGFWKLLAILKNHSATRLILVSVSLFFVIYEAVFFSHMYFRKYPHYASDYWGWQSGPEEIIKYFKSVQDSYDDLFMSGYFNAPGIFIPFFDPTGTCKGCRIAGIDSFDPNRKQLFAVRPEDIKNYRKMRPDLEFKSLRTVDLPGGNPEFYVGIYHPASSQ